MKKILISVIFFLYSITFVNADQITLVADIWCPFTCDPSTEKPGYMVEVARAIFEKHGHSVVYEVVPWTRAIEDSRIAKYSGIIGSYVEDAPDFFFPDNEIAMIGFEIFVNKVTQWTYKDVLSLSSISLGVIRDYAYNEEIDRYIKKNMDRGERIQVANGESPLDVNMRKLSAGEIDALIENPSVFWHTAEKMGLKEEFKSAGVAVTPRKAFIAFSPAIPSSSQYARILSEGIDSLRRSGELDQMLSRYGLKDWSK